ncbi:MAG TPA: UTP--glucose-1-phosphate uridylyltransferase GalU [Acidimicrobiales bacterium]|nr:UTP--glucose-1-phosphate uridylyltransferase GalU [Acidimicrobiales bacterium]
MGRRGSLVNKAVIPAAGLGTRFLPATKAQPKEMLPLVDKPAIQYVVEEAVGAGLEDILIITGRGKRSLEDHFDRSFELEHYLESRDKKQELAEVQAITDMAMIHYVRQKDPLGLGHAVSVARGHVGQEPFAVLLGDDIMNPSSCLLEQMLETHDRTSASVLALKEVRPEEISSYGCAVVDRVDAASSVVRVRGIVEKPPADSAPSNLAVIGRYVLSPAIFRSLERVSPGAGGEIQLTDGIADLMESEPVYGVVFDTGRYDVGNKLDYIKATIELALEREELGPALREFILKVAAEGGPGPAPAPGAVGP